MKSNFPDTALCNVFIRILKETVETVEHLSRGRLSTASQKVSMNVLFMYICNDLIQYKAEKCYASLYIYIFFDITSHKARTSRQVGETSLESLDISKNAAQISKHHCMKRYYGLISVFFF